LARSPRLGDTAKLIGLSVVVGDPLACEQEGDVRRENHAFLRGGSRSGEDGPEEGATTRCR
jgi:hypothetical protein